MSQIAIIRMKGKFSLSPKVRCTLKSFSLNRLYACTLVPSNESMIGMLQICKDVVSYGEVDEQTVHMLLSRRGMTKDNKKLSLSKKPDEIAKLAKEISASDKKMSEFGVLQIFSLAPPRGGLAHGRKLHVPTGIIGKNKGICELIASMA